MMPVRRLRSWSAVLLVPIVLAAACSSGEPETAAVTSRAEAPEPVFGFTFDGAIPTLFADTGEALGSGCSPGPGDLPDGIWFGSPTAWSESSIDFDLACFYTGDGATAEAAARGEESPPPNDYIITNDNPTLRTVPVVAEALGHRLGTDVELDSVSFAEFIADPGAFQDCPDVCLMWIFINDGQLTEIVSQYVP